jgi:hypothetical protein
VAESGMKIKISSHFLEVLVPSDFWLNSLRHVLIFLRRKVPGQTGARTRDLRQHRLSLNTNALTIHH